jgi:hypothetical protein
MSDVPELYVEIPGGRTAFAPGEALTVNVLWALPETPSSLEVRLCWHTQGKGTEDIEIVDTRPIAALSAAGENRVTFDLPDGPYSFSGKLISLLWSVEFVAEPGDKSALCDFVLSPAGREIVLEEKPSGLRAR